jgi:hypothetical protein
MVSQVAARLHILDEFRQGGSRMARSLRRNWAIAGVLLLLAFGGGASVALATTGPTPLAHPPRFTVTKRQARPYLGRFRLIRPSDRNLISGAYIGGRNERGYVEGAIEIYHYEAAGRKTILLGRTYEYHAVGRGMVIDVISPANQVILARLRLHPIAHGRLTGHLTSLVPPGPPRRITLGMVRAAGR